MVIGIGKLFINHYTFLVNIIVFKWGGKQNGRHLFFNQFNQL